MKNVYLNISSYVLRVVCVVVLALLSIGSLKSQGFPYVVITSTGIVNNTGGVMPDDLFNNSHLPNDFYSTVFDAAGNPIMDHLVILTPYSGLTGSWTYANGYTGLVEFTKQDNYYASVNAGIDARRVAEIACISLSNMNGKKIYITGSCQNAYTGNETTEGFIYIAGGKGEDVDVYLHNVDIKTQSKRMPGQSVNQWLKGYITGNASPIAIASTSDDTTQPFQVNFHIRDTNTLTGGATSKLEDTGGAVNNILADILYLSAAPIAIRPDITIVSLYDTVPEQKDTVIQSSMLSRDKTIKVKLPATITTNDGRQFDVTQNNEILLKNNTIIADDQQITSWQTVTISWEDTKLEEKKDEVVITGLERYRNIATKLTFDDVWPTSADGSTIVRTNGILNMPVVGDLGAPSIDLGNEKGQVEFNGGQYKFHTPRTNSMFYVSSMAICYRSIRLAGFETIGVGGSVSAGSSSEEVGTRNFRDVVIKDGTFMTYPAEVKVTTTDPDDTTPIDVVQKGWYRDYTDLRLPYNARIMGGAFNNCKVYRCDGSGEQGVSPMYVDAKGDPILDADQKEIPMCWEEICVSENPILSNGVVDLSDDQIAELHPYYGHSSLTPIEEDGNKYVHVYLTSRCTDIVTTTYSRNWVTLIPEMGVKGLLTMGGDQTVNSKTMDGTKDLKNKYLFYARLNEYTKNNAFISLAGFDIEVYQAINMITGTPGSPNYNPEAEFAQVTNEGAYTIEQGLYTMLSFPSNEWQLISLPYDVHNIYVMETTSQQLGDSIKDLEEFLKYQGKADGKLAQNIVTSLCPDIFSGKGSGVNMNLIDIATQQIDCPPFELTHYNGSNANAAHYYLYEQLCPDPEDQGYQKLDYGYGTWQIANDYSANWSPVVPSAPATTYYDEAGNERADAKVLMKAGGIYNLFLPSGKDRYWDGKYLIFEGYGPQLILGSDKHSGYLRMNGNEEDGSAVYEGEFSFQGNRTFANFAIDTQKDGNIFLPVRTQDSDGYHYTFKPYAGSDSVWIHPCEVYGVTLESGIESVSMRGAIMRRTSIATGSTPVVGNTLLYAYAQPNGLLIDSRADQYVQVIAVDGQTIFAGQLHDGEQKQILTTTGIYVVCSDGQAIKLLVP